MTVQIHIEAGDALPIYRQVIQQITDALASGRLAGGDQLPSQRDLAEQLVISPLTVKKAYDELERDDLIETRRGRGTFVRKTIVAVDPHRHREQLRTTVRRLVARAHLSGIPVAEVVRLIEEVDAEMRAERAARRPEESS